MKKNIVKDGFGYDLDRAMKEGNIFERVFHKTRLNFWFKIVNYSNKKILDVGCNTGILLIPFLNKGFDIVGIDISEEDILKAKKKLKDNNLSEKRARIGDASDLPFKSDTYEVVILSDVLEHVKTPEKVVKEALRVLKKNGLLVATVPNEWHPVVKFTWVRKLLSGRGTVDEFPDTSFTLRKLISLFPKTKTVKKGFLGFYTELYCVFKKI